MTTTTVIDNEFVSLLYHVDTKIVHHSIKKYTSGPQLRELLEGGYEVLKKHHATKWLSDDLNSGPIATDDEEWAGKLWFPKTIAAGWKHWAIVKPAKVLGQLNMRRYKETYSAAGVNTEMFSEVKEAMLWLERQ
ncbi:MAG TPA: hypothetical protein VIV60_37320 [Polyangiaceae bacterium]